MDIKTQLLNLISKLPDGQVTREGLLEVLEDKAEVRKKRLYIRRCADWNTYFFLSNSLQVEDVEESDDELDEERHQVGNYFLDKEPAQQQAKRIRTLNRLWQFASQVETDDDSATGYQIVVNLLEGKIEIEYGAFHTAVFMPMFKTREAAELVLDSLDADDIACLKGLV